MLLILLYQLLLLRNRILFWSDFLNEGSYLWMSHIGFIYVVNKMQWGVYVDSFSQSFRRQVGTYPKQPLICFFLSDILINEEKSTEKILWTLWCDFCLMTTILIPDTKLVNEIQFTSPWKSDKSRYVSPT